MAPMKIAVGCDHRGYAAKRDLLPLLQTLGHQVEDFGCPSDAVVDYPDIAYPLAVAVALHKCDLGILLDGNGMGMSIVANKVPGVRAAAVHDEFTACRAREQHHCNIICLAADLIGRSRLTRIVEGMLLATSAAGRHARRIEKLAQIEAKLGHAYVGTKPPPLGKHPYPPAAPNQGTADFSDASIR
jgi:ribose 5-phosphate isomerase B